MFPQVCFTCGLHWLCCKEVGFTLLPGRWGGASPSVPPAWSAAGTASLMAHVLVCTWAGGIISSRAALGPA